MKGGSRARSPPALEYGLDKRFQLFRFVLAIGVEVDDDLGLLGLRYGEARPEGVALPRLTTWLTTGTPSALAMSAVLSAEPSSTTTVLTS